MRGSRAHWQCLLSRVVSRASPFSTSIFLIIAKSETRDSERGTGGITFIFRVVVCKLLFKVCARPLPWIHLRQFSVSVFFSLDHCSSSVSCGRCMSHFSCFFNCCQQPLMRLQGAQTRCVHLTNPEVQGHRLASSLNVASLHKKGPAASSASVDACCKEWAREDSPRHGSTHIDHGPDPGCAVKLVTPAHMV